MSAEGYINRWWRVVGALLMNLSLGSLYAWSIFIAPLEKEFGWTRADTSWIFTIAVFVFGISFVIAGRLQDKLGPFKISVVGSIGLSLGFILASFTNSLAWIFFTFGGIMGFGNGFGYATPIPVLSKWFPDRRGLAVGLAVAGYGGGSAILAFIGPPMLTGLGWRGTFLWLGIGFFAATMIGSFMLKNPPAGYKPEGWTPAPPSAKVAATTYDYPPSEMVKTPQFPLMWIGYCLGTSAGLMTISQLIPFARSVGLPATAATLTLLIGAIGNASGRIFSGWLSDAIGRLQTLRLMILVSAIIMPILANTSTIGVIYVLLFVVYYCYGTQLSVFPSTTADFFGTKNLGVNYGWVFTAWGVAGIVGPMIGGYMFRTYKTYTGAFYTAGILAVIALIAMMMAKRPEPVTAKATA
ncbi:MAG: OFA family MFS transporter [candidate division NC10 bacterium]|nr:OFA family MFS transporter [candidate division NC10 bacterium]MBI2563937.1 OFA family MFS transporter [candidate division NC10 bacterium]